jgi:hypothetical protein
MGVWVIVEGPALSLTLEVLADAVQALKGGGT